MVMMTFADAARELGVHPLNLVLRMHGMVGAPPDFWPSIHPDLVDAMRARMPGRFRPGVAGSPETTAAHEAPVLGLTEDQLKVVVALWRKGRWSFQNGVPVEGIRHFCRDVDDLEAVLDELCRQGILVRSARRGSYGLNPSRKGIIDHTAERHTR